MSSPSSPANDVSETREGKPDRDLKRILKLQLPVIAVLAQKYMKMGEVLNLSVGSIIQLDKPSEDLLDLMVNDRRIGRGETVRIGENFGLQIVEIGPVAETIRKLGADAALEAAETEPTTQADAENPPETAEEADTPASDA